MTHLARPIAPPISSGRFAVLLLSAAGAMLFLALLATLLVLRDEQTLLFRAHSGLLPKTLQTLGTALLLGACGCCTLASRFKNMVTTERTVRLYTALALLGATALGTGFCVATVREWSLMLDRVTLLSRAPADVYELEGSRKSHLPGRSTSAATALAPATLPAGVLYVTDAYIERHDGQYWMEGVTAPLPVDFDLDLHRLSRPEITGWSDATWGRMRLRDADVVALQRHGPGKNVVYASYFALSTAALLLAAGLTFVTLALLARHVFHRRVFETAANVGVLWGFVALAWVFSRMML